MLYLSADTRWRINVFICIYIYIYIYICIFIHLFIYLCIYYEFVHKVHIKNENTITSHQFKQFVRSGSLSLGEDPAYTDAQATTALLLCTAKQYTTE